MEGRRGISLTGPDPAAPSDKTARIAGLLERNSGRVVIAGLAVTAFLLAPFFLMKPSGEASFSPGGEAFDLRDEIGERFPPSVHGAAFLAEARSGDMLTQASLSELFHNETRLRAADEAGELAPTKLPAQPYLTRAFDVERNREFAGVSTIADAVQDVLRGDPRFGTTLESATDAQVKLAVHRVLSDPATAGLANSLSRHATRESREVAGEQIDYWVSPAIIFGVAAVNEKLGGGTLEINVGGGEVVKNKEEFNRNVQRFLRGDQQAYRLWGVAIDAGLEADDEGQTAGIFVMYTVIGAVLIVGLSLRSYWAMALTGAGLGVLIIWLKGISNLVGLEGGLVIDLIVPIAMVSLGVDFAIHTIRRYQEGRASGSPPRAALRLGLAGVAGALVLAMLSDAIAFLSNAAGGIEAIIHFGVAAGIAVGSAFLVLGVIVPLALMWIEEGIGPVRPATTLASRAGLVGRSIGLAVMSGAAVIFLIVEVVPPGVNVAILAGLMLGLIALPAWWARRRGERAVDSSVSAANPRTVARAARSRGVDAVEASVAGLARYRFVVIAVAAAVTAVAALFAIRLDATLDVKDFFDNRSDFVVSLDEIEKHVGDRGGEPGVIYIEGDLTDPQAVLAIGQFVKGLEDNPTVARRADGRPDLQNTTLLDLLGRLTASSYAREQVRDATGVEINDEDDDGVPDSRAQIAASYDYAVRAGVPLDAETLVYAPVQVVEALYYPASPRGRDATTVAVGIPGTREQANVVAARDALADDLEVLKAVPSITRVGLTGSPFTRQAELDATTRSLQLSIPIAAAGALVLLLLAMRSLRYAVVTIIPIGLVVAWLYGLMYGLGFALNFVTATIGAVSIGVGVDYSIHMTERYREELKAGGPALQALRRAARGTGVALAASAASSVAGFAVMGLAPMPLFSSYGVLTAIMISLAFAASVLVLPSLLLVVTPGLPRGDRQPAPGQKPAAG